ncbi:MAG: hypothetical protein AB1523_05930 [Bacillota bacterium]
MKNNDFSRGPLLNGLLKGLSELAQLVEKLETEGKAEIQRSGQFGSLKQGVLAGGYGLNIRLGSLNPKENESFFKEKVQKNEPLLDVFDEGDYVQIIVELPEISTEEGIEVKLAKQTLLLTAHAPTGVYQKNIFLPVPVESKSIQKSFKNGILKLILKKML